MFVFVVYICPVQQLFGVLIQDEEEPEAVSDDIEDVEDTEDVGDVEEVDDVEEVEDDDDEDEVNIIWK